MLQLTGCQAWIAASLAKPRILRSPHIYSINAVYSWAPGAYFLSWDQGNVPGLLSTVTPESSCLVPRGGRMAQTILADKRVH